ncbi:MAG: DUF1430 domain-containing protein [Streptococcaceae bacterium]|jgi:putative ABC transport system permease protein|nr:DUF1430 domain-containing protein [Streptococcaceae bacterium]
MYKVLKKLFIIISFLGVSILSIWYVGAYKNAMFGGVQQAIAVNKSTININSDLEQIAKSEHLLIAKQIIATTDGGKGEVENTFAKIGQGEFPEGLIEQKNQKLIQNSESDVVYLLIGKKANALTVANQLNQKGNEAIVFQNNWLLTLLANFIKPQLAAGILVIVSAFIAIIFSEYIARLKNIGVERLAGKSRAQLAFEGTVRNVLFVAATSILAFIVSASYLGMIHQTFGQIISMVALTISVWGLILIGLEIIFSIIIYTMMRRQKISDALKGKAPLRLLSGIVLFFQAFALLSSMFTFSLLNQTNQQTATLQKTVHIWSKNKEYYGLTQMGWDKPNPKAFQGFMTEVANLPGTFMVTNQFDNQTLPNSKSYLPSANSDENVLYVNPAFLKKAAISLSANIQKELSHLEQGQYVILIPSSQGKNQTAISSSWKKVLNDWNKGAKHPVSLHQFSAIYKSSNLFAYPVLGPNQTSNEGSAKAPLLIVYGENTFANTDLYLDIYENFIPQTLVTQLDKVVALIEKYHLQSNIGSLRNGYSTALGRMGELQGERTFSVAGIIVSSLSSLVLIVLLTRIYLYQNRRKYMIERLAGKSIEAIHKVYIGIVAAGLVLISLIAVVVLHLGISTVLVPIAFGGVIATVFIYLVSREKEANSTILKGE